MSRPKALDSLSQLVRDAEQMVKDIDSSNSRGNSRDTTIAKPHAGSTASFTPNNSTVGTGDPNDSALTADSFLSSINSKDTYSFDETLALPVNRIDDSKLEYAQKVQDSTSSLYDGFSNNDIDISLDVHYTTKPQPTTSAASSLNPTTDSTSTLPSSFLQSSSATSTSPLPTSSSSPSSSVAYSALTTPPASSYVPTATPTATTTSTTPPRVVPSFTSSRFTSGAGPIPGNAATSTHPFPTTSSSSSSSSLLTTIPDTYPSSTASAATLPLSPPSSTSNTPYTRLDASSSGSDDGIASKTAPTPISNSPHSTQSVPVAVPVPVPVPAYEPPVFHPVPAAGTENNLNTSFSSSSSSSLLSSPSASSLLSSPSTGINKDVYSAHPSSLSTPGPSSSLSTLSSLSSHTSVSTRNTTHPTTASTTSASTSTYVNEDSPSTSLLASTSLLDAREYQPPSSLASSSSSGSSSLLTSSSLSSLSSSLSAASPSWQSLHTALLKASFPGISTILPALAQHAPTAMPWRSLLATFSLILDDNTAKAAKLRQLQSTLASASADIMELERKLQAKEGVADTPTLRTLENELSVLRSQLASERKARERAEVEAASLTSALTKAEEAGRGVVEAETRARTAEARATASEARAVDAEARATTAEARAADIGRELAQVREVERTAAREAGEHEVKSLRAEMDRLRRELDLSMSREVEKSHIDKEREWERERERERERWEREREREREERERERERERQDREREHERLAKASAVDRDCIRCAGLQMELDAAQNELSRYRGDLHRCVEEIASVRATAAAQERARIAAGLPDVAQWGETRQTLAELEMEVARGKQAEVALSVCMQRAAEAEDKAAKVEEALRNCQESRRHAEEELNKLRKVVGTRAAAGTGTGVGALEVNEDMVGMLSGGDLASEAHVLRENVLSMRKTMAEMESGMREQEKSAAQEISQLRGRVSALQEELSQRPLHSDYDNARKVALDVHAHATDSALAQQHVHTLTQAQLDKALAQIRALEKDNEILRDAALSRGAPSDVSTAVDALRDQLTALRRAHGEDGEKYRSMIEDLQNRLTAAEQAKNALKTQLSERATPAEVDALRSCNGDLEREVRSLRDALTRAQEQHDNRRAELLERAQELEDEVIRLRDEVNARPTAQQLAETQAELEAARHAAAEAQLQLSEAERGANERLAAAENTRRALEGELEARKGDRALLESLRARVEACGEMESALAEGHRRVRLLTEENSALRTDLSSRPTEEDLVLARNRAVKAEREREEALRAREREGAEAAAVIGGLRSKVSDLEQRVNQLKQEVSSRPTPGEWREKKAELQALREATANEKLVQIQQSARAEAECNAALARVRYLENENKTLVRALGERPSNEEFDAVKTQLRDLQMRLLDDVASKSPVKQKQGSNEEFDRDVAALREHVDMLQRALDERPPAAQWEQAKARLHVLEEECASLRSQCQSIQAQARADAEVAAKSLTELTRRAEAAEALVRVLERRPSEEALNAAHTEITRLQKQITAARDLEAGVQALVARCEAAEKALRDAERDCNARPTQEDWEAARTLVSELQTQLAASDSDRDAEKAAKEAAIAARDDAMRLIESARVELANALAGKQHQDLITEQYLRELQTEVGKWRNDAETASARAKAARDDLDNMRGELAECRRALAHAEGMLAVLPSAEQWRRAQEQCGQYAALLSAQATQEAERMQLSADLARTKRLLADAEKRVKTLQERMATAPTVSDLALAESVVEKLKAEVITLTNNCAEKTREAACARAAFEELRHAVEGGSLCGKCSSGSSGGSSGSSGSGMQPSAVFVSAPASATAPAPLPNRKSEAFFVSLSDAQSAPARRHTRPTNNTSSVPPSPTSSVTSSGSAKLSTKAAQRLLASLCTLTGVSHPSHLADAIRRSADMVRSLQQRVHALSRANTNTNTTPGTATATAVNGGVSHGADTDTTPRAPAAASSLGSRAALLETVYARIHAHLQRTYGPAAVSAWSASEIVEAVQGCMQGVLRPLELIQSLAGYNGDSSGDVIDLGAGVRVSRSLAASYAATCQHLQRLFGVAAPAGIVPKANELYLFVCQTHTALGLLREMLRLGDRAAMGVVVRAVRDLIVVANKGTQVHVQGGNDGMGTGTGTGRGMEDTYSDTTSTTSSSPSDFTSTTSASTTTTNNTATTTATASDYELPSPLSSMRAESSGIAFSSHPPPHPSNPPAHVSSHLPQAASHLSSRPPQDSLAAYAAARPPLPSSSSSAPRAAIDAASPSRTRVRPLASGQSPSRVSRPHAGSSNSNAALPTLTHPQHHYYHSDAASTGAVTTATTATSGTSGTTATIATTASVASHNTLDSTNTAITTSTTGTSASARARMGALAQLESQIAVLQAQLQVHASRGDGSRSVSPDGSIATVSDDSDGASTMTRSTVDLPPPHTTHAGTGTGMGDGQWQSSLFSSTGTGTPFDTTVSEVGVPNGTDTTGYSDLAM